MASPEGFMNAGNCGSNSNDSFANSRKSSEEACVSQARPSYAELAFRKAEEAASRRFQAASWLREMLNEATNVLSLEPTEEEFRQGLRNGIILCNVLNKVNPGAVPKVIENPDRMVPSPDGAALSAIQYFENVRNFLVAVDDMGIIPFEVSDLEEGGSISKVVDCVLALKAYYYWKQTGIGFLRYGINIKFPDGIKFPIKGWGKPSDQTKTKDLLGNFDANCFLDYIYSVMNKDVSLSSNGTHPSPQMLSKILLSFLSGRKDDGSVLLESMARKIIEEFEQRLIRQRDQLQVFFKDLLQGEANCLLQAEVLEALSKIPHSKCDTQQSSDIPEPSPQLSRESSVVASSHDIDDYERLDPKQKLQYLQQNKFWELKCSVQMTRDDLLTFQHVLREEIKNLENQIQGLAKAASGYHQVLEENRQLYNQVQDLKGNIRVYCRVRPFLPRQADSKSSIDFIGENGTIMIVNPLKQGKDARRVFTFNKVFRSSATQEEVFLDTRPLIRSVLDGYNVCIFAYGQTGSGKTYTMSGPLEITEESWGVNYRALNDLFEISRNRKDVISYQVNVQMVEIYNEQVRDLLVIDGGNKRLEIRNNSQQNGLNVPDASLVAVSSTSDVIHLMNIGHKNRAVGSTALNDRSSRSHSVLTIHVQGTDLATGAVLRGCLHLVDLAGSERVDRSEATGERLKEAQHINKSLSALGDVVAALAQKSSHVPYRNSKLTQLLQESLGGQAKALMFVHVSPEADSYGETLSTLKFAERVASVELGAARSNKESAEVRELKEQIYNLKVALAKKEMETEQLQNLRTSRIVAERQSVRGVSPLRMSKQSKDLSALPNGKQAEEIRSISTGRLRKLSTVDELDSNSPRLIRRPSPERRPTSVERRSVSTERRSVSVGRKTPLQSRSKSDLLESQELRKIQDKVHITKQVTFQNAKSPDESSKTVEACDLAKRDSITEMFYRMRNINTSSKIYPDREDREFLTDFKELDGGVKRNKVDPTSKYENLMRLTPEGSITDDSDIDLFRTSDFSESELLQFKDLNLMDLASVRNVPRTKRTQQVPTRNSQLDKRSPIQTKSPSSASRLNVQPKVRSGKHSTQAFNASGFEARKHSPARKPPTDFRVSNK